MCGIAGAFGRNATEGSVRNMTDTLKHRGPDGWGVWFDPEIPAALGHRRLAIIDLSACGSQPMVSHCGRWVIVFNGEIYNFRALRAELEGEGVQFRGHSDTEVMLEMIARRGIERAVTQLVGMFAFALVDAAQRRLFLVRDRFGKKPLYYALPDAHTVIFGSELKSLRVYDGFDLRIDLNALAGYLRYGYVSGPESIYERARKVPAGAWIAFDVTDSALRVHPARVYWSPEDAARKAASDPLELSHAETVDQLDRHLRDAVSVRLESDVPLGAFLSGGIDSSLVVALMHAEGAAPVRTFTIGFDDAAYDESTDARRIADALGTQHTERMLSPQDCLDIVPRLPFSYDEPFADSSQIPTLLVSALAREHVTVALSGDGGDEVFGGYNRHVHLPKLWDRVDALPRPLRAGSARLLEFLSPEVWDTLFARLAPFIPRRWHVRTPAEKIQKLQAVLQSHGAAEAYDRVTAYWQGSEGVVRGATVRKSRALNGDWDFTQQMMLCDSVHYLVDDILVKVDRASMAYGLEVRAPLLDHRVFEFAWRLPRSAHMNGKQGKLLLRAVLSRYVDLALVDRPKMGFAVPIDAWLRGPLREWAETLLARERIQKEGFFDGALVQRKWKEHIAGSHNWRYELWAVLMFQAWYESTSQAMTE